MKAEDPKALRFIFQDELYLLDEDKSLYNTIPDRQSLTETPTVTFNYLGSNKKNFLILVNYADHEFMDDAHLTALEKVLAGIAHQKDDVAILNLAKHANATHGDMLSFFEPSTMVMLGKEAIPAGLEQPQFNLPQQQGGIRLLYTFGFSEMMANNDHKKAFWDKMKTL